MLTLFRLGFALFACIAVQAAAQTVDVRVPGMQQVIRGPVGVPLIPPKGPRAGMRIRNANLKEYDYLMNLDSAPPITVGAFEFLADTANALYIQPSKFAPGFTHLGQHLSIHTVIDYIDGYSLLPDGNIRPMDLLSHYFYGREAESPGMADYAYIEYRTWHAEPNPGGGKPRAVFEKDSDGMDVYRGMILPLWRPDANVLAWRKKQANWSQAEKRKFLETIAAIGFWVALLQFSYEGGILQMLSDQAADCKRRQQEAPAGRLVLC